MIIVKLIGGLGNQLFQYAAGRRLAHVLEVELKLDIAGFEDDRIPTPRRYSLGNFNIQENFASAEEAAALSSLKRGIVERVLAKVLHKRPTHISQKHFYFDPAILTLSDGVYLDGYWQSEKYFVDITEIIRREFTVKFPQTEKNKDLEEMITSRESVSLHVRRGDYVSNPKMSQEHSICEPDYYLRCVEQLTRTVKDPHFFVFSDDSEWSRDNLKQTYPTTFVDHNKADRDYEDLRLMSLCRHHIIANSSFSWWGAWLNTRNDKIVFAPKQWFTKKVQSLRKMDDLLPATWNVL